MYINHREWEGECHTHKRNIAKFKTTEIHQSRTAAMT